jgi:predicted metal-binding protein
MEDRRRIIEQHMNNAEQLEQAAGGAPAPGFLDFYENTRQALAELLSQLKSDDSRVEPFELRVAMMPPGQAVVDESIKELCRLPYRTPDGPIPACPGITRGFKGCPPHAPDAELTKDLLRQGTSLLVMQFVGREGSAPQGEIHRFIATAVEALKNAGYTILETYASGPCKVCPKGCGDTEECRFPDRRLFAFEACGFWVPAICRAAAEFPVQGDGPREIRWIKNWRLETQDTDSIAYTTGILLKR